MHADLLRHGVLFPCILFPRPCANARWAEGLLPFFPRSCLLHAFKVVLLPVPPQALDYGVPESNVLGIRFGFQGFYSKDHKPVTLSRR